MKLAAPLIVTLLALAPTEALAQAVPDPPSVRLVAPEGLRRGQPSPRDGLLVEVATYLGLTSQIENLEWMLGRTVRMERDRCEREVAIERHRTTGARDALQLRESLWQTRQVELLAEIEESRRAAERQWWEQPILWFMAGGVVIGAIIGGFAAALNN